MPGSAGPSAAMAQVSNNPTPSSNHFPLLDPKNDYVFKRIFAQRIDLLTDLVNVIRGRAEPLLLTEVLNPNILPGEITGKEIVLDVRALDAQGRAINVEVQVSAQRDYPSRALYYVARTFVDQLEQGEKYGKLQSVIGVNLLNFALFRDQADAQTAQWRYSLRSDHAPRRELDIQLELNFLELPKLARLGLEKTNKPLYDWGLFFSDPNGVAMEQITHPNVQEAFAVLKSVSATAEERADAERRIKYVRDLNAMIDAGWDEGRAEGIAVGKVEGIALGRAEGKAELLERLLEKKFGLLSDSILTGLFAACDEQLNLWAEDLLLAKTIEDIFL
ncbi:MAG: Rpn family recombination-promoting nuclease/putative transposase [Burkholderiaceae bacterium]